MYPNLFINSSLSLPSYYLVNSLIAIITLFWLRKRTSQLGLSAQTSLELYFIVAVAGFLGARAFHAIYEEPLYYFNKPQEFFYFWQGGFVFYGGALIGFAAGWIYLQKKQKKSAYLYMDLFAPLASLSYALGRLGCFLAGCCYGTTCTLPWAIQNRHPTQLYSFFFESLVLVLILRFEKTKHLKPAGSLFFIWVFLHALGHFMIEQLRDDDRGFQLVLSVSSWISLILMLVSILVLQKKSSRL